MKTLLTLAVVAFSLLFVHAASAAPPKAKKKPVKEQFYDMGGSVIDGEIKRPTATWISDREKAGFPPLATLKKRSFFPALFLTSQQIRTL
jgi:hypothetical protein